MPQTLIKNGIIVSGAQTYSGDVLIEGEQIVAVGDTLEARPDHTLIDAAGLYVLPGIVDAHTHIKLDTGIYQTADN